MQEVEAKVNWQVEWKEEYKFLKPQKKWDKKQKKMIGYNLITHQTTKEGLKVNAVLVHEGVDIKRQIYFAFILDRNTQGPAIVASTEGGV